MTTPDRSSGENTRSKLAEHASSTFCWFLHFRYPKTTSFFKFFGVRLFKRGFLYHKYKETKCCSEKENP